MAILVHPGTAGADYNSYISLSDANAYHEDRATPAWSLASEAAQTAALIRATDFIDASYTFRVDPFCSDAVNALLVKATAAMAVYALSDTLADKQTDQSVTSLSESLSGVGTIATSYSSQTRDPYPLVTAMLSTIASRNSGGGIVVTRMVR